MKNHKPAKFKKRSFSFLLITLSRIFVKQFSGKRADEAATLVFVALTEQTKLQAQSRILSVSTIAHFAANKLRHKELYLRLC